jgi:hypothetical protein
MRATILSAIGVLVVAVVTSCQTAPRTASQIAARTQVLAEDGFGRPRSVIGPQITMAKNEAGQVIAHLAVGDADEIWMLCVALVYGVPPNFMRSAYTSDRKQLPLVRLSHDMASGSGDRFTVVLPRKLLNAKRDTGVRLKLYGTRAEIEVEIPAWYLAGFLSKADSR